MGKRILDVTIKTQDDKGHIGIYHAKDIVLDSIVFKGDQKVKKEEKSKK